MLMKGDVGGKVGNQTACAVTSVSNYQCVMWEFYMWRVVRSRDA